jgi:branched-subunit amino acid transport protein
MTIWVVIVTVGIFTFAVRASFVLLQGEREFPEGLRRALRFVPASVLAAIVWPAVLAPDRQLDLSPANLQIYAAAVAVLVAWRTRNILATIASGMATLWVLQAILASY